MQLISDYEKTLIILFSVLPYKSLTQTPFRVYALSLTYLNPAKLRVLELLFAQCIRVSTLINPLNADLNPICPLLALFRGLHILRFSR